MPSTKTETTTLTATRAYRGTTPRMHKTIAGVTNQARDLLFTTLTNRPETAYVEYLDREKQVGDHGTVYAFTGDEDVSHWDEVEHMDDRRDVWTGTVTVGIKAVFEVKDV
ncbi:hypothetical protein AWENTII_001002 [Aspergillus wentii]|nr:hypothetical protein MW887_001697 [Aspergillus wentii]